MQRRMKCLSTSGAYVMGVLAFPVEINQAAPMKKFAEPTFGDGNEVEENQRRWLKVFSV